MSQYYSYDIRNNQNKYYQDYTKLEELTLITYGKHQDMYCIKKDFLKYQKKILELKNIFRTNNLSPIEKLIIAYDIVKQKTYKQGPNDTISGTPHNILFNDFINCRGYTNLLLEILDGENIKIVEQSLTVFDKNKKFIDRHGRCTVILDDDKYNIHGLFIMDPTFDCYYEENKEYLDSDLKPTDLYCYFF